jgi:hypothetical protein
MKKAFELAVKNIANFGDTDVFPYPVDNAIFFDRLADIVTLLEEMDSSSSLKASLDHSPLAFDSQLVAAGYFGFRNVTQIDPLWNAFLLGKVLQIAPDLEARRLPVSENVVFSYRYLPDYESGSLFDRGVGWHEYQQNAVALAAGYEFVVSCDISNFYSRIYHHRLENALQRATSRLDAVSKILSILREISKGTSYGLPVGGPAARILSEILLNNIDVLLVTNGIRFARFVDDFYLFAKSKAEAYRQLIFLSEKLLQNEGLSLQKSKTRIITSKEFLNTSEFVDAGDELGEPERVLRKFRKVKLHFDPYSITADEDYETLKQAVSEFDIVGMLRTELRKTRIHEPTTRKLLTAIKALDPEIQIGAIKTILDNLEGLISVFPKVALLLRDIVRLGNLQMNEQIFVGLYDLFSQNSPVVGVPVNAAYALRVLAHDPSLKTDILVNSLYQSASSIMLRRDIINVMTHKGALPWLSDKLKDYSTVSTWEKRALLIASFSLTDEGSHWRRKLTLNKYDTVLREWAEKRKNSKTTGLPI